jgi:hypothetical protein
VKFIQADPAREAAVRLASGMSPARSAARVFYDAGARGAEAEEELWRRYATALEIDHRDAPPEVVYLTRYGSEFEEEELWQRWAAHSLG